VGISRLPVALGVFARAGIYTAFVGNRQRIYVFQSIVHNREPPMNFLEDVPAIRRIDSDRADLLAVDIVGHVAAADAENLFGLLEAAYALHPKIDVLVRIVDHDGVDWSGISDDTLKQGKADALRHVARCATVGEPDWTADARGWFEPALTVEVRHFEATDERAAWQWLGATPAGG
jgi:hypothetical protein